MAEYQTRPTGWDSVTLSTPVSMTEQFSYRVSLRRVVAGANAPGAPPVPCRIWCRLSSDLGPCETLNNSGKQGGVIISSRSSQSSALGTIRVEPVQARSSQRLATLLDSTAEVVRDIGYETLTTAMVAERAGASIGTVYRYFPDRIAVLQALIARNRQRAENAVVDAIAQSAPTTVSGILDAVIDCYVTLFREEAGFRSLRLGDVLDIRPAQSARGGNAALAHTIGDELAGRLSITLDSKARMALETVVDVIDSLLSRAFLRVDKGDQAVIQETKRVAQLVVAGVL